MSQVTDEQRYAGTEVLRPRTITSGRTAASFERMRLEVTPATLFRDNQFTDVVIGDGYTEPERASQTRHRCDQTRVYVFFRHSYSRYWLGQYLHECFAADAAERSRTPTTLVFAGTLAAASLTDHSHC